MPVFKSKLEEKVWARLKTQYPSVKYEPDKISFIQPAKDRNYIPDFKIGNIYIEAKGKLDIQKQAMLSMGFDVNKDQDNDGTPDVLEVAKYGVDAEIKRAQVANEARALEHKIQDDKEKNRLKAKEIAQKGSSSK